MTVKPERVVDVRSRIIGPSIPTGIEGPVVYWMNRDQRVRDNWALLYAQTVSPSVIVVVCLHDEFIGPSERQRRFHNSGLHQVSADLLELNIPFYVVDGAPKEVLPIVLEQVEAKAVITDFEPLHRSTKTRASIARSTTIPFHVVDAHNVIPTWISSDKLEFAAYTIRPKITRLLSTFIEEFPSPHRQDQFAHQSPFPSVDLGDDDLNANAGYVAGMRRAEEFIRTIENYEHRNDPLAGGQSGLSPFLHFGHISAQEVTNRVLASLGKQPADIQDIREVAHGFLEELIVRRELSDNFTHYNPHYDSFDGIPNWAKTTLDNHRTDKREFVYSFEELDGANTHDELWNAAQKEMQSTGKMHGYMRMYWAKKILEWTASPEEAMSIAQTLNDTYSLDGSDPNGYTGVAWSIGGVHDRAWAERPVFGKIRYMNASGCKRKFDVASYIRTYE